MQSMTSQGTRGAGGGGNGCLGREGAARLITSAYGVERCNGPHGEAAGAGRRTKCTFQIRHDLAYLRRRNGAPLVRGAHSLTGHFRRVSRGGVACVIIVELQ